MPQCALGGRKWVDGAFVLGPEGREGVHASFRGCSSLKVKAECIRGTFRRATPEQAEQIAENDLARNESELLCSSCRGVLRDRIKLAGAAGAALGGAAGAALQGAVISGDGGRRADSVTWKALYECYLQQCARVKRSASRYKRERCAPDLPSCCCLVLPLALCLRFSFPLLLSLPSAFAFLFSLPLNRLLHRREMYKVKLRDITGKYDDVLGSSNPTVPYALRSSDDFVIMIKRLRELEGEIIGARAQSSASSTVSIKDVHGRISPRSYDAIVILHVKHNVPLSHSYAAYLSALGAARMDDGSALRIANPLASAEAGLQAALRGLAMLSWLIQLHQAEILAELIAAGDKLAFAFDGTSMFNGRRFQIMYIYFTHPRTGEPTKWFACFVEMGLEVGEGAEAVVETVEQWIERVRAMQILLLLPSECHLSIFDIVLLITDNCAEMTGVRGGAIVLICERRVQCFEALQLVRPGVVWEECAASECVLHVANLVVVKISTFWRDLDVEWLQESLQQPSGFWKQGASAGKNGKESKAFTYARFVAKSMSKSPILRGWFLKYGFSDELVKAQVSRWTSREQMMAFLLRGSEVMQEFVRCGLHRTLSAQARGEIEEVFCDAGRLDSRVEVQFTMTSIISLGRSTARPGWLTRIMEASTWNRDECRGLLKVRVLVPWRACVRSRGGTASFPARPSQIARCVPRA